MLQRDGPFGRQARVLWLCQDHRDIVDQWQEHKLSNIAAVDSGMEVTRRWVQHVMSDQPGLHAGLGAGIIHATQ